MLAFISIFLPFISGVSMLKLSYAVILVIPCTRGALALYALRMETIGFLVSLVNLCLFVHMWTYGAFGIR